MPSNKTKNIKNFSYCKPINFRDFREFGKNRENKWTRNFQELRLYNTFTIYFQVFIVNRENKWTRIFYFSKFAKINGREN